MCYKIRNTYKLDEVIHAKIAILKTPRNTKIYSQEYS